MKWVVRYDYEMPGWDEFNYTQSDSLIVEADSAPAAIEKFLEAKAANTERNSLKFSFHPFSVSILKSE